MRIYLFDCDGTLYDDSRTLAEFLRQLCAYVGPRLNLSPEEVLTRRKKLKEDNPEYDSTIALFARTENFNLREMTETIFGGIDFAQAGVTANAGLRAHLLSLHGPHYLWTNNPRIHGHRALTAIGIRDLFTNVFGLEDVAPHEKPAIRGYEIVERSLPSGAEIIFVEDTLTNLAPANVRGWETVWLDRAGTGLGKSNIRPSRIIRTIEEL